MATDACLPMTTAGFFVLFCFVFFTKIKRPLRALSAIYRSQLRQIFRRF